MLYYIYSYLILTNIRYRTPYDVHCTVYSVECASNTIYYIPYILQLVTYWSANIRLLKVEEIPQIHARTTPTPMLRNKSSNAA